MTSDVRNQKIIEIIGKHREILSSEEKMSLNWSETLMWASMANLFVQPLFMGVRYRRLPAD